jgi:hypothetical protein
MAVCLLPWFVRFIEARETTKKKAGVFVFQEEAREEGCRVFIPTACCFYSVQEEVWGFPSTGPGGEGRLFAP